MSLRKAIKQQTITWNKSMIWISLFILVFIGIMIISIYQFKNINVTELSSYMPKSKIGAELIILLLYTIKALLFFIPVQVLYILSGMLFSPIRAVVINSVGLVIEMTLTFYLGKLFGQEFVKKYVGKSKRTKKAIHMSNKNNMMIMAIRMVPIFPIEPISVAFGGLGYEYTPYIIASVLGLLPGMIPFAIMGNAVKDPMSKEFLIPFGIGMGICCLAIIIYNHYEKKK